VVVVVVVVVVVTMRGHLLDISFRRLTRSCPDIRNAVRDTIDSLRCVPAEQSNDVARSVL
jgi:hypothetical protein